MIYPQNTNAFSIFTSGKIKYTFLYEYDLIFKFACLLNFAEMRYFLQPIFDQCSLMDKPGSQFLLAKCLKNTCGRVTF